MKVFKFGGASINHYERIINTGNILAQHAGDKLLVVISAMGKTTNSLELVAESFYKGNQTEAIQLFEQVKQSHLNTLKYLNLLHWQQAENHLKEFFTEAEWLLHDKPVRSYDYYYDQLVCIGELLSTTIVYHYLLDKKVNATWLDVRDIIRTDNHFRDASIDWDYTSKQSINTLKPLFERSDVVIVQGFIGATEENESTTLGREGSDYTAAIFANILDAESVTIWKDVEAVMSADPKKYPDAQVIESLSFTEVIEMAYYGAQVIHPKTIKPLQNKQIPLLVRSFLNPDARGTSIAASGQKNLPPIIVHKENQVMIRFRTKDFSFMGEGPIHELHQIFNHARIQPNLSQITAISLIGCFDDRSDKIEQLAGEAAHYFEVELEKGLSLLTIRHYSPQSIEDLTKNAQIILEQKTPETIQLLMKK